jgi:hypothetical protein
MELIAENLFERVLLDPITRGCSELYAVTGYVSAAMITKHFEVASAKFETEISIDVTVGMSGLDGLSRNTLRGLGAIPRQIGGRTFNCSLTKRGHSNHSKLFVWCDEHGPKEAYLGSGNYTQLGFGLSTRSASHRELFTSVEAKSSFEHVLEAAEGTIGYRHPDIEQYIEVLEESRPVQSQEDGSEQGFLGEFVDLPLVSARGDLAGEVPSRSGLNWGQREGRNPNQAYIPVPVNIARTGFFPERGIHFQVVTDDGEAFICTVAQDNDKAIETPHNNALLGAYFRKRLGLKSGELITRDSLDKFGSTSCRIYKIDIDTYGLDFRPSK